MEFYFKNLCLFCCFEKKKMFCFKKNRKAASSPSLPHLPGPAHPFFPRSAARSGPTPACEEPEAAPPVLFPSQTQTGGTHQSGPRDVIRDVGVFFLQAKFPHRTREEIPRLISGVNGHQFLPFFVLYVAPKPLFRSPLFSL